VVAAWNDLEFDLRGYIWMSVNCLSSAAYVLSMRYVIKSVAFKEFDTVFYNNFLTTPIFVLLSFYQEDWSGLYQY
jgi:GDP-mannose transporter